jgi:hypothetical protein
MPPSNAATSRVLADSAAPAPARQLAKASAAATLDVAQGIVAKPQPTLIVVDRAYVDSVLAADSSQDASGGMALGGLGGQGASASKMRADASAPTARSLKRASSTGGFIDRAAGCYTVDTTAWLPRSRDVEAVSLVPSRIELRRERGLSGDEWGNLLTRPAPGEPALPPGAVGFWKPLGSEKVRIMLADNTSWVSLTLVVGPDSIRGPARAFSPSANRLRSAHVTGRRVLCRTEP